MNRARKAIPLLMSLAIGACTGVQQATISTPTENITGEIHKPPFFEATNFDTFFAPYRRAFGAVAGSALPERQLVQLGLPDMDTIVIWYALDERAKQGSPLRVVVDGEPVPSNRVHHVRNTMHKTGRIEVSGLRSATTYRLTISGAGLTAGKRPLIAKTASGPDAAFSFLFGSCFAPYSTVVGRFDNVTRVACDEQASMLNFRDRARARAAHSPSFFIGLGDQLYVDAGADDRKTARIAYLFGKHSERIRGTSDEVPSYLNLLYRLSLGLPAMDAAFADMPSVMMWDDHDIRDGWGSHNDESNRGWRRYYQDARDAFVAFQGARNPNFNAIVNARYWDQPRSAVPIADAAGFDKRQVEEMDFTFDRGLATFFVADGRSAKWRGPQLRGRQFERIKKWLSNPQKRDRPTVFVFAFPVPVAANIGRVAEAGQRFPGSAQDDSLDRIHPDDRKALLELFAKHFAKQLRHTLVIISGDVHYSGLQSIRQVDKNGRVYGYEVISSGLAQTKYNTGGGFWVSVSGAPRGVNLDLEPGSRPWVQDHGMYSGPCFAELFVAPATNSASAPQIGLEFYPAKLNGGSYRLSADWLASQPPHAIVSYPENRPVGWWPRLTRNELPQLLKKWWVDSARATPVSCERADVR
jgi:phosphodiesterase/alkaline phosphatase D-like protein